MYYDLKLLKLIFEEMGSTEYEQDMMLNVHINSVMDVVIMKIFNHYAENATKKEIEGLEEEMRKVGETGDAKAQKYVADIFAATLQKYPDLIAELKKFISDFHKKIFLEFMKDASSDKQMDVLAHLLKVKGQVQTGKAVLENYEREVNKNSNIN